jgi:hypothetical protein
VPETAIRQQDAIGHYAMRTININGTFFPSKLRAENFILYFIVSASGHGAG